MEIEDVLLRKVPIWTPDLASRSSPSFYLNIIIEIKLTAFIGKKANKIIGCLIVYDSQIIH